MPQLVYLTLMALQGSFNFWLTPLQVLPPHTESKSMQNSGDVMQHRPVFELVRKQNDRAIVCTKKVFQGHDRDSNPGSMDHNGTP